MDSFYGGKPGISFTLVEHFNSIEEMVQSFSQGGLYTLVNYGEYIIIDTVIELNNKSSLENGIVYQRGYNYNEPIVIKPNREDYKDTFGKIDEDSYEKDMNNYFLNPGGGAVYIGKIVGPIGDTPYIKVLSEKEIENADYVDEVSGIGTMDIVAGNTQNRITYRYCNIRDKEGNIKGCVFGITIPYHVFEFNAESLSPYSTEKGVYDENTGEWKYSGLINRVFGNDNDEPFWSSWQIQIPKGIKGASIESIGYNKDYEYYYTIRDYSKSAIGEVYQSGLGLYHNVISKIEFDENTSEFIFYYTGANKADTPDKIKARMLYNITIAEDENGSQKFKVTYSDFENGERVSVFIGEPLNYINKVQLNNDFHLLVLYSDPIKRASIAQDKQYIIDNIIWEDLGYIRGETGGIHIIGHLDDISQLPVGGPSEEYRGWVYTVTNISGKEEIYAWDYENGNPNTTDGWYSIGSIDATITNPMSSILISKASNDKTKPVINDTLNTNGYWFVVYS